MTRTVISVQKLGKQYAIGCPEFGQETFREMIISTATAPVRRLQRLSGKSAREERIWALKDLSFDVKEGKVLGIVGRNGAGKSTLLKILSRITEPTEGRIEIRGRVASLLEVGTGFHPELTGRENVYLNGAILGMSRAELDRKFDAIVDFSGVERFIDTPVKRYSSGMSVRLAFAVAAHLEPEIFVVDEVLAVGDIEFQKKCLGKIGEVARGGRTVLFVSHNLTAVETLCDGAILLKSGRKIADGPTREVIETYVQTNSDSLSADRDVSALKRTGRGAVRFLRISFFDYRSQPVSNPKTGSDLNIALEFSGSDPSPVPSRVSVGFSDAFGTPLFGCDNEAIGKTLLLGAGDRIICRIPRLPLSGGRYLVDLFLERNGVIEDWLQESISIDVVDASFFGTGRNISRGWEGRTVLVANEWWNASERESSTKREDL